MPRPTKRAGGLALGAALLFVIGTNVQAGWLFVLSSLLLGVLAAGLVLPARMVRGLEIERRSPAEAFQDDEVHVELVVGNAGRGSRLSLELEDAHVRRARLYLPSLRPGERAALATRRRASRRGVAEAAEVVVSSTAPFGVARARRVLQVPGRTTVYPRVARLGTVPVLEAFSTFDRATHARGRRGHGHDFLGVREYRVGDSMRHVHWPSTARHGAVMVREFEQEHMRRLGIVVDTLADRGDEDTPLDLACSIAASVALAAMGEGHGIQLAAARDGEALVLTEPDRGALLERLADLRPSGGLPLPDLLREAPSRLRGSESLLIVAPTWRANARLPEAVDGLRGAGIEAAVALVDVGSFPEGRAGARELDDAAVEALGADLGARGVAVTRLRHGEDVAGCLAGLAP